MTLVGLLGTKGVGKDTVGDYLVSCHDYEKRAFATPIKEACSILFQLPSTRFEGDEKEIVDPRHGLSPRQMMQLVGTDFFRGKVHKDFWIRHFQTFHAGRVENSPSLVVTDLRFQNEVDLIKSLGGMVLRITRAPREGQDGRHTTPDLHITEQGVALLQGVDATIENDASLEDLFEKVDRAIFREEGRAQA